MYILNNSDIRLLHKTRFQISSEETSRVAAVLLRLRQCVSCRFLFYMYIKFLQRIEPSVLFTYHLALRHIGGFSSNNCQR